MALSRIWREEAQERASAWRRRGSSTSESQVFKTLAARQFLGLNSSTNSSDLPQAFAPSFLET